MIARAFVREVPSAYALERQGSRLTWGKQSWNMVGVHGPLPSQSSARRQFFRVITAEKETLIVYREKGERGMRKLFLFCLGDRSEKTGISDQ